MQRIPEDTYLINRKATFCPSCGKYRFRITDKCSHCRAPYDELLGDLERCVKCRRILAPKWSYCEVCGQETRRSRRLKRAKMLSSRAKVPRASPAVSSPAPRATSPDLFQELDVDLDELDSLEASASMPTAPPSPANDEALPSATPPPQE